MNRPRSPASEARVSQLAGNLGFAEGPAFLPDGRIIFTELWRSRVGTWSPAGGVEPLVYTGGAPNAVAVGSDGSLLVTQNGGRERGWWAPDRRPPSIQYVPPQLDQATVLVTEVEGVALGAPNDLAFGPDETLYFTDPAGPYDPDGVPPGYLFALKADGSGIVLHEAGPTYPNGIGVAADGSIVWTETVSRALKRLRMPSREVEHICTFPEHATPDGFAMAANGDLYVATLISRGVTIVSADGEIKGHLSVGALPTNCAFRGSTLYVADGGPGSGDDPEETYSGGLYAVELSGVEGVPTFSGQLVRPVRARGDDQSAGAG